MKKPSKYELFIFVISLVITGSRTSNDANPCKGARDGALFPNPKNCHGFIKCSHGRPSEQKCGWKLMFNPVSRTCDYATNVKCPGNRCLKNNGGCSETCVYIDNNSYGCVCKPGFKMDTDQKTCVRDSIDMDSYCDISQHGQTLPHPLTCKKYVRCVGSVSHSSDCTPGLVFDAQIKQCNWDRPGICKDADFNPWSSWSRCFKPGPEERCMKKRTRKCKPQGQYCQGFKSQVQRCSETKCKKVRPCELNNGGCSDICTEFGGKAICSCHKNRKLSNDKKTCTKEQCGVAPLRNDDIIAHIVEGQDALRGGYPWQVAIYVLSSSDNREWLFHCGGTLIGRSTVISAAHCFPDTETREQVNRYKLVLGEYDRNKMEGSEQKVNIKEVRVHENFNQYTLTDDIALIKLSQDVQYSNFVTPACLPKPNEELKVKTSCRVTDLCSQPMNCRCRSEYHSHRHVIRRGLRDMSYTAPQYCIGWGRIFGTSNKRADRLQEITIPVVDENVCKDKNVIDLKRVTSSMVCAGFDNGVNFESACHGDSGGPLSCMSEDGTWKVYGVVSWGDPQCGFGAYNVFTKTSKYVNWINKKEKENKQNVDEEDEELFPEP